MFVKYQKSAISIINEGSQQDR